MLRVILGKLPRYSAAMAAGALLTTAYAPRNLGLMIWFWMLPLLIALWIGNGKKIWSGFRLGLVAGLTFYIPNLAWVRHSSRVIYGAMDERWMGWPVELLGCGAVLGLAGYLALYWGLWGAFAATIGRPRIGPNHLASNGAMFSLSLESLRSAFLNAAAWTGLEWLRGVLLTGFPWNGLGVPMASQLSLIQSADLVGVTGLSFLPVFCACIAFNTALRFREEARTSRVRPHLDFFFAVGLVLLNFLYGFRVLSAPASKDTIPLNVLLVQQNIAQATKWSGKHTEEIYQGYGQLTRLFASRDSAHVPDLVIWPESALPLAFHDPNHIPFLNELLSSGDFSLLTGVDILMPNEPAYTGAALMRGSFDNHQLYRKIQLVPFGEYLPLRSVPLVDKLLGGILPGDFAPGNSTEPFMLEKPAGVQVIPLICFEDTFGRHARKFVNSDHPQLLVNCTNDGWFLHSEENEQHLANALFRCVELRRPMARAANTGVSCFIDNFGRINKDDRLTDRKSGSVFIKGCKSKEIRLEKNPPLTFYARHGDLFSITMLGITALVVTAVLSRRIKRVTR